MTKQIFAIAACLITSACATAKPARDVATTEKARTEQKVLTYEKEGTRNPANNASSAMQMHYANFSESFNENDLTAKIFIARCPKKQSAMSGGCYTTGGANLKGSYQDDIGAGRSGWACVYGGYMLGDKKADVMVQAFCQ